MSKSIVSKDVSYLIAIIVSFFCLQAMNAQNLVLNPSFEDFIECPKEYGTFQKDVLFWKIPTYGSTDYFNSCSTKMATDRNFTGKQDAYHGNAYAGFYAYGPKDYREYISGELKGKLVKDRKYIVSAMVSLSEKSEYAIDELGFILTHKELDLHTKRNIPYTLMVKNKLSRYTRGKKRDYFSNKEDWMEVKGTYIATGNEQYLIFGNFKDNRQTRRTSIGNNLKKAAYYYVDMIAVKEAEPLFNLDEIYVFEGLNFDVDGFKIGEELQVQLQPLISFLKENPALNISIYGHTDNVGSSNYNRSLSERRAKTLGLFLVDNGLSPFRIAWQGYGDEKPILPNETESGRKKNRRVEFIISKKKREFYASGLFEDEEDN